MKIDLVLAEQAKGVLERSGLEDAILFLRNQGLGKIETIKIIRTICCITLSEAKEEVHCSKAWEDRLASDNALHDVAFQALEMDGWVKEDISAAEHPIHSAK